jgi:hypothetical protein
MTETHYVTQFEVFGDPRAFRDCLHFHKPRFVHFSVPSFLGAQDSLTSLFQAFELFTNRSCRCSKCYWRAKGCSKHSHLSKIRSCKCSKLYRRPSECSEHSVCPRSVHVGVQSVSGDPVSVLSIQSVQDPFM